MKWERRVATHVHRFEPTIHIRHFVIDKPLRLFREI